MGKISLQMYTMRDFTKTPAELNNTLERLKEIGFSTLQYSVPDSFDTAEVKKMFDSVGIKNDSVFCPCLELENREKKIIGECEMFETDFVRTNSIPAGLSSSPAGYKMFAHYLNEVTAGLKKEGKKLLYHFHAFEFIRFGNTTGIEILINETNPEAVQLIPDTHWIHSGGKSIIGFLEKYSDRYEYIHTKDFAIGNMGAQLEMRPILFAPVGEGNIEWDNILAFCKKKGVKSYAIEQDDCYGRDPFDCVKSSFDYLKRAGVESE